MNSRQLQYAIALSEIGNFSQVADKLKISQPALSKQILSLENELGVKLFDRSTNPLTLTAAGDSFIQQAKELQFRQEELIHSMERFRSGKSGRLIIGISPFRTMYMIPSIAKKVREAFPGVQVFLHEAGSDTLRKEIAEGKYDFAIVNLPVEESVLNVIPLDADTLVLAVPNSLLHLLPDTAKMNSEIALEDCSSLPFIVVGKSQEMRVLFDRLCIQADFLPEIAMEVVGLTTAWAMAQEGIGATILPLQLLRSETFNKNITLFTLKNNNYSRQPVIVYRKGKYLSDYAQYAINLLSKNKAVVSHQGHLL